MIRTRVGYAGGTTDSPTYHNIGDHSETIQIDYNPDKISYEELLRVFWDNHSPTTQSWSTQYRSIIFYHNEEQRQLTVASRQQEEARSGKTIVTEIVPFSEFYLAEEYHQKYYLQHEGTLMEELRAIYPAFSDFLDSTVAARINGFLGGHGSLESLEEQIDSFGLSAGASSRLLEIAGGRLSAASCSLNSCV